MRDQGDRVREEPGYLDMRALAAYASCSVRWLRQRLRDPEHPLPHYRVRGKVLVRRDEFDAWMQRYRVSRQGVDLDGIVNEVVAAVCGGQRREPRWA